MTKQVKLHSAYNPQREAERFCGTIRDNPKIIIITEPGESYLVMPLRKKFPKARLIAIRYTDHYFLSSDKMWDAVWRPANGNLLFFLINNIPDELLSVSVFLPWKPADTVWQESADFVWKTISSSIKLLQSLIATRSFFGKRWLKNIFYNFIFAENPVAFEFTNNDSVFAASGPSLEFFLTNCKAALQKRFILAASSAAAALLARSIRPTLCITTDGGFWASGHLKNLPKNIVTAFPPEARVHGDILKNNPCLFLNYGSALENLFFTQLEIPAKKAKRNGSVSGTAADFLLDHTGGNIYAAGLDLKPSKGFAHVRPHESKTLKEESFTRVNTVSGFAALSNLDGRSLAAYAAWFSQMPKHRAERIFRIGTAGEKIENIHNIDEKSFIENANPRIAEPAITKIPQKTINEKKSFFYGFYKNLQKSITENIFFENLKMEGEKNKIEKELCSFISFQNYIRYIKALGSEAEKKSEENLKSDILLFTENMLQRLKDE